MQEEGGVGAANPCPPRLCGLLALRRGWLAFLPAAPAGPQGLSLTHRDSAFSQAPRPAAGRLGAQAPARFRLPRSPSALADAGVRLAPGPQAACRVWGRLSPGCRDGCLCPQTLTGRHSPSGPHSGALRTPVREGKASFLSCFPGKLFHHHVWLFFIFKFWYMWANQVWGGQNTVCQLLL